MTVHYSLVVEIEESSPEILIGYSTEEANSPISRGIERSEEERSRERGTRESRDIIIETFRSESKMSASGASGSSSLSRKSSNRSLLSRESTPAGGSKDFPPLVNSKSRDEFPPLVRSREGSLVNSREGSSAKESKESTPSDRSRHRSTKDSSPCEPDSINFISGNPFVEVTKGVIHLFKDAGKRDYCSTEMMCMYGVPAKHKTSDLLQFTAPCHADLEYLRIIHDGSPNQYMVLLKFRCAQSAAEFHSAYNGLPYNSLEPDICAVLPVSWVEHCKESEYYPNTATGTELPYCTICLERMDESVSTVLTILCNHKFHSVCLAQWEDPTCPVCRHVQTPELGTEHVCSDCQSSTDLWICLVCGYVGCGRYAGGHAHQHFLDTQHCYSMELGHNRVWDYVGDNFVHRLVQNTSDGKLVEQEGGGAEEKQRRVDGVNVDSEEKMDSLQLEYTYLLTSQLESQRDYFESKMSRMEETAGREAMELSARAKFAQEERLKVQKELELLAREKIKNEGKVAQLSAKLNKLTVMLEEEKQLNRSLTQNQEEWQKKLKRAEVEASVLQQQKDKEIEELKEQVRDMMFFLEAQDKIKDSPLCSELAGGSISVPEDTDHQTPRKKGARKRKS